MPEFVAIAMWFAAWVAFWWYYGRPKASRRPSLVWAFAFLMLLWPALGVWSDLRRLMSGNVAGLSIVLWAGFIAVQIRFFHQASTAVSAARLDQEVGDVLEKPLTDLVLSASVGGVLLAVVGGVALAIWALLSSSS